MTRLIDADALFINLDGMMEVSPTGYIHGDTVADMISDAPTVEAIPVEFIKSEIKENKGFYNSNLRRLLDAWAERKEE